MVLGLAIAAMIVPLAAMFLPLGAWLGRATSWIPVFGTIVRDNRHSQFSHLMALLLKEEVPLPEALGLAVDRLARHGIGKALSRGRRCRGGRHAVGQGLAIARFPDSLTALVAWGQQKTCLAEAFRAAAEAFEARTNSQTALLNMLALPLIYMLIVTFVGVTILALVMPLTLP